EVGPSAGVQRYQVTGEQRLVLQGGADHRAIVVLRAELRVDLQGDRVEPAVLGRRELPPLDAAGALDGPGVQQVDADLAERVPQFQLRPGADDRLTRASDNRAGVPQYPDRSAFDDRARLRISVGVPPLHAEAGYHSGLAPGLVKHRMLFQPAEFITVG